jgi:hypothetical protein
MIETLLGSYLIVGLIVSLVIWHTVFQPDYDEFVKEYFDETPPTTSQKWFVIVVTPLIWPVTLWRAFRE